MWVRVVYLLEVFATLACIHCIYGKKIKWDVKPIALCLSLLVIYEVANNLQNGGLYTLVAYIPIFIYCKRTFGTSILQTLVKIIWLIILLTAIEFLCLLFVLNLGLENVDVRNIISGSLVLVVSVLLLPRLHIHRTSIRGWVAKSLLGCAVFIMLMLILQGKFANRVNISLYVIVVPIVLMLLYILVKWLNTQSEVENMKQEVELINRMDKKYAELVEDIRVKQHGFKNHITAILSSHYTYNTYERLVEVQDEYCNRLMQESKYSNLLLINDKVLSGFLYEKFREIECDNIEVKYEIRSSIEKYAISTYHLIEILGILLDNATDAAKCAEKKTIVFVISSIGNKYMFIVRNISKHVAYTEIENWFNKEVSSKGENRGLGLYYVKKLCQELNCDIYCRNVEYDQNNWIEFSLEICKADRG